MTIDPSTFTIVSQGLGAIAQEMGEKLVRSAYSTIIREARDCSTSLLDNERPRDRAGAVLPDPHELVHHGLRRLLPPLRPLDPPTERGADHQRPVQRRAAPQRLRALHARSISRTRSSPTAPASGTTSTSAAARPDRTRARATSSRKGCASRSSGSTSTATWGTVVLEQMIRGNVRPPDLVLGDVYAQIAANKTGETRLIELIERFGPGTGAGRRRSTSGLLRAARARGDRRDPGRRLPRRGFRRRQRLHRRTAPRRRHDHRPRRRDVARFRRQRPANPRDRQLAAHLDPLLGVRRGRAPARRRRDPGQRRDLPPRRDHGPLRQFPQPEPPGRGPRPQQRLHRGSTTWSCWR